MHHLLKPYLMTQIVPDALLFTIHAVEASADVFISASRRATNAAFALTRWDFAFIHTATASWH